jgi:hypothetical protein
MNNGALRRPGSPEGAQANCCPVYAGGEEGAPSRSPQAPAAGRANVLLETSKDGILPVVREKRSKH